MATFGTNTQVSAKQLALSKAVRIDTDKYVYICRNATDEVGSAAVITLSGLTPTINTFTNFTADSVDGIDICPLSSTKVIVVYRDTSGYGRLKVGTISETSITFGAASAIADSVSNFSVVKISDTVFVVTYLDYVTDHYEAYAKVATVTGDSASFGDQATLASVVSNYPVCLSKIGPSEFLCVYQGASSYPTAKVGTISSTSIAFGSASILKEQAQSGDYAVDQVNSSTALIVYRGGTGTGTRPIYGRICSASGTSLTLGDETTLVASDNNVQIACSYFSQSIAGLLYRNGVTGYVYFKKLTLNVSAKTITVGDVETCLAASGYAIGISENTFRSGADKGVITYTTTSVIPWIQFLEIGFTRKQHFIMPIFVKEP